MRARDVRGAQLIKAWLRFSLHDPKPEFSQRPSFILRRAHLVALLQHHGSDDKVELKVESKSSCVWCNVPTHAEQQQQPPKVFMLHTGFVGNGGEQVTETFQNNVPQMQHLWIMLFYSASYLIDGSRSGIFYWMMMENTAVCALLHRNHKGYNYYLEQASLVACLTLLFALFLEIPQAYDDLRNNWKWYSV